MFPLASRAVAALAALLLIAGATAPRAVAQSDFPNRPLRIVVANTPGSTVDLVARHLGERMMATLGQPIVIVNQPGAAGLVGSQTIAQAPKDGCTLGFYGNTAVIVPHLQKSLAFDPIKDITTVKMGSAGNGTAIHLAAMQFQSMAGIDLLHVPYKGVAPMQTALLSGEIDVAFPTVGSVAGMIKEGRVRALGTTGKRRAAVLPQVPTIAEAGLPGYEFESWLALVAPAGVPASITRKLGDDVRVIVAGEATQKLFADNSITPEVIVGDAAQRIVMHDFEVMGGLVRKSGATAN